MKETEETKRQEWLEKRRKGIGGSDVAPIMGLSTWSTAYDVWKEKIGLKQAEGRDTRQQAYGKLMEGTLRDWYTEETGRKVVVPDMIVSPEHPFMLANLDGITGDQRIVEIKTARSGKDWDLDTVTIPVYYATQVQHYMIVTGFHVADVVVSIAGSMPEIYEIPEDIDMQRVIVDAEREFWQMVQENRAPEPVTFEDALARFGGSAQTGVVLATTEAIEAHRWIKDMKSVIEELSSQMEKKKAIIMNLLADEGDTLTDSMGVTLVTWKLAKGRKAFDTDRFREEHPDLYDQYVSQRPGSRRFLPK